MTTPNDSWLPSPGEPLFILAMDQRASFAKTLFDVTGTPSQSELTKMREAKSLVYEGLRHVAGSLPSGREGVLVDEDFGTDVARKAKSDGVVLLMPIEKSGSEVFEVEYGDQFAQHVEAFDPDFFKVLVRFNPLDDEATRRTQIDRLAMVSQWAERVNRRWVFELLVPPTPEQLAAHGDQDGFDLDARPELTAEVISQLHAGDVVLAAVAAEKDHPAACIVLGRDAPIERVEHWLKVTADKDFVGFAVGRTIWEEPLRQHLSGALSSEALVGLVGNYYTTLVHAFVGA